MEIFALLIFDQRFCSIVSCPPILTLSSQISTWTFASRSTKRYSFIHKTKFSTRWLYFVECPQYSILLEALGYLCTGSLLPAFDEA